MNVLFVVPSYPPATAYGGPLESTRRLAHELASRGAHVKVLTTNADGRRVTPVPTDHDIMTAPRLTVRYCARRGGESISPQLLGHLPRAVAWADVVHLTGVYSFPTLPTLAACRARRKPLVWCPRGSLQRWAGTRRPAAKTVWEAAARTLAPRDLVLHVTSAAEANAAAARVPARRVVVIPNGIDVPATPHRPARDGPLSILFLGRLDPIKGLERLLQACGILAARGIPFRLEVAGDGAPAYRERLERLTKECGIESRVRFLGHVDGAAKEEAFMSADVLVLPSHSENFGMVVAEALARGVPVVASRSTPWQDLDPRGCGRSVDAEPQHLADALADLVGAPLEEMGARGRAWMKQDFAWSAVGSRLFRLCRELAKEPTG